MKLQQILEVFDPLHFSQKTYRPYSEREAQACIEDKVEKLTALAREGDSLQPYASWRGRNKHTQSVIESLVSADDLVVEVGL